MDLFLNCKHVTVNVNKMPESFVFAYNKQAHINNAHFIMVKYHESFKYCLFKHPTLFYISVVMIIIILCIYMHQSCVHVVVKIVQMLSSYVPIYLLYNVL